ncbi:putative inactive ATP-dependent zinc metalloprotease FTSHI 5 [Cucumis melo var. makuwa]|uniref:Inactive ATP-dependent zinc metalloprotease FTSHI 5 n=2 Tax=Cucumis melo var. makuwa TaxID=1194695 RepID=A0A5A7T139_CUCMM|nr:putative inactive ATP-dependent zinc metalloprotease FTSHI 5 [Cucumis melo var. makuwa]
MGDSYEYEVAAKVEKIYDLAYCRAKEMLGKNRQVLEKFVEELLEFEILTGKVLERLIETNGGIREKEPFFLSEYYDREYLDELDMNKIHQLRLPIAANTENSTAKGLGDRDNVLIGQLGAEIGLFSPWVLIWVKPGP